MSALAQTNSFSAHLALPAGVAVSITAPTLNDLQLVVTRLQPAANDILPSASAAPKAEKSKAETGNASASTGAQASVPPAASGSAPGGDAPRPTYDDVKARVLKLAKVSRETATAALAKFGVDHGNKLKLEQYPEFLAHADKVLSEKANG